MSLVCTDCSGDVLRFFVGETVRYRHAVAGIDHAPMPIDVSASKSGQEPARAPNRVVRVDSSCPPSAAGTSLVPEGQSP